MKRSRGENVVKKRINQPHHAGEFGNEGEEKEWHWGGGFKGERGELAEGETLP